MTRFITFSSLCLAVLLTIFSEPARGQNATAEPRLGPGSLITIAPDVDYSRTHNRADMVEVLATLNEVDPELADDPRFNPEIWAKEIRFTRDVWCLQFSFKPVRIIEVDIPNTRGGFDKKAVWYLVYNVKNIGPADFDKIVKERKIQTEEGDRSVETVEYTLNNPGGSLGTGVEKDVEMPVAKDTKAPSEYEQKTIPQTRDAPLVLREMPGFFEPIPGEDKPIRFVPQFILATDRLVLETQVDADEESGTLETKTETEAIQYVDRMIPIAIGPIMKREGMNSIPETTVGITTKPLQSGEDLWGVALWTDVDPRITKFSIYVSGLSNEYRWTDDGSASGSPGEGRSMEQKVLKTNWWRKGDRYSLSDSQIQYGQPGTVDFEWLFR